MDIITCQKPARCLNKTSGNT